MTEFDLLCVLIGPEATDRLRKTRGGTRVHLGKAPADWLVQALAGDEHRAAQVLEQMTQDGPRRIKVPPPENAPSLTEQYSAILRMRANGAEPRQIAERVGLSVRQIERVLRLGRRALEIQ